MQAYKAKNVYPANTIFSGRKKYEEKSVKYASVRSYGGDNDDRLWWW